MEATAPLEITAQENNPARNSSSGSHNWVVACGIGGASLWVTVFSLGLLIDSKPYRNNVISQFNLSDFIMCMLTYTPTNIVILCLVAAFAGGCASRLIVLSALGSEGCDVAKIDPDKKDSHYYMMENPFSSMMRGLAVYFAFLAGAYVSTADPFGTTTAELYGKAAGFVSLLSFVVGYDPSIFKSIVNITEKVKPR